MLKIKNCNVFLGQNQHILRDLSLDIKEGEFALIIGENGAGKSTLFNAISGYIPINSGSIELDQEDITFCSNIKRAKSIAKVLQDPSIATIGNMTIEENMTFAYMRGYNRCLKLFKTSKRLQYFQDKISLLCMGLENRMQERVENLSGGQRQALSLIMAIIADSKILLLDEITAALDFQMAERVMELAYKLAKHEKRTTLMITHNKAHIKKYGDRIFHLMNGKLY